MRHFGVRVAKAGVRGVFGRKPGVNLSEYFRNNQEDRSTTRSVRVLEPEVRRGQILLFFIEKKA
jgi:hypothetical protein